MTDQTVSVPVAMLQKARDYYRDYPSAQRGPLAGIFALIPTPPKVGDTLTAAQIKALPLRSVVVDQDGDLWIKGQEQVVSLLGFSSDSRPLSDGGTADELARYNPVLAHLPKGK